VVVVILSTAEAARLRQHSPEIVHHCEGALQSSIATSCPLPLTGPFISAC